MGKPPDLPDSASSLDTNKDLDESGKASPGILKKSETSLSELEGDLSKPRVTFSILPSSSQNSLRRSVPDLRTIREAGSQGSSFDSSRSLSDEGLSTSVKDFDFTHRNE